ncbi:amidase family protein [Streptomyces abikoensis]|uniref:amidase family protein n=1 Tax=Streptomyces abikoensis TaxID=97398 RepID=UPI0036868DFF
MITSEPDGREGPATGEPAVAARADQSAVAWPDGTIESVSDAYVRLSAPANITGAPALSLPVGLDGAGLPIGTQLIGRPFGEATLLGVGRAVEDACASLARPAPLTA